MHLQMELQGRSMAHRFKVGAWRTDSVRHAERDKERESERGKARERKRDRASEREREANRQTERHTDTHTHRCRFVLFLACLLLLRD